MALFKISRGGYTALPENKTDGWAYFTPGNKGFYIDVVDTIGGTGYNSRIKINERVDIWESSIVAENWTSNVYYLDVVVDDIASDGYDYIFEISPKLSGGIDEQFNITSAMTKANISYSYDETNKRLVLIANGTQPTINLPIYIKRIPSEVAYVTLF